MAAAAVIPLIMLAAALTLAAPAFADVIELKTGQRVEGTLKQATPASVSVEVGGQTITFEGEKVRAIYYGAAPPTQKEGTLSSQPSPDRFVLWSTMNAVELRRPIVKNVMVHDTRETCADMAAKMNRDSKSTAQQSKLTMLSIFYQCLPVGVQPTP